ncbi:MAG: cytidylate kinase-like family protein [Deltaproteobacteria bacterium]|nr:cytidylate kinase-like family protein [Deltaproteobacteria bacterium]
MLIDKLIPNIDRRISTWIKIQEELKKEPPPKQRPTITISRQFGAEAYPLAEILQELLQMKTGDPWTIFDKALIEKVSRETALSENFLTNLGDASRAFDALLTILPGMRTHSDAFKILSKYIIRIALDGNAIIIGRGGAVLTQHLPHCFHFRLEAPLEFRIRSIQERLGITSQEAKSLVDENQKMRERFIESFLNVSISDTRFYHAVFNNSKSNPRGIAQAIMPLIFENWGSERVETKI